MGEANVNGENLAEGVTLYPGDCLSILPTLEANSVDSCVTDPPYHLTSIVKRFGADNAAPAKVGQTGAYARASAGFMGKKWDGGDIAFRPEFWAEVLRVLKPGAHLVAFGASRGYHRMACAIEDAGFEIRDSLMWLYGTGFPKSHDVSKGIDKLGPNPDYIPFPDFARHYGECRAALGLTHAAICALGGFFGSVNHGGSSVNWEKGYALPTVDQWSVIAPILKLDARWKVRVEREQYKREVIGKRKVSPGVAFTSEGPDCLDVTLPGSDAAREWEGWGTALKPAFEPIVLARKPLSESTIAANVLRWGTGALNIGACKIPTNDPGGRPKIVSKSQKSITVFGDGLNGSHADGLTGEERWPANILHDGSDDVVGAFPNNAARFFYASKASKSDRAGSKHPTVKPISLIQYLCRLVTPPGGLVLDPFSGSGTTGEAARRENFRAALIEMEPEYQADIRRRFEAKTLAPDKPDATTTAPAQGDIFGGAA